MAISKGQIIWPFMFRPTLWPMKEDQNIKKEKHLLYNGFATEKTHCFIEFLSLIPDSTVLMRK